MGKWAPAYHDQVLGGKIKALVNGVIMRSSLEREELGISYESFVEDFDTGDSFTTTLVDILVKEIADRRSRPRGLNSQRIGLRTARSLNELVISSDHYREIRRSQTIETLPDTTESSRIQRLLSRSGYVNESTAEASTLEEDEDEDDDFGTTSDPSFYTGTQALHDSYAPPRFRLHSRTLPPLPDLNPFSSFSDTNRIPLIPPLPPTPAPPPSLLTLGSRLPPAPRMTTRRPSSVSLGGSSSLHRTSSIRRASRARASEFAEFSSRRRSDNRSAIDASEWPSAETGSGLSSPRSYSFTDWLATDHGTSGTNTADITGISTPEASTSRSAAPYLTPPTTISRPGSPSSSEVADALEVAPVSAPRLRRGGLAAPEVLQFPNVMDDLASMRAILPYSGSNVEHEDES